METWEEKDKGRKAADHLKEYEVRPEFATREKKKGRAKGGVLLAIRKGIGAEIEWKERFTAEAIAAKWKNKGKTWLWGVTYMRHSRNENYKIMEEWVEDNKEGVTIINGDFNARTAEEGGLWNSEGKKEERKSKDKILNEEGKELVNWVEEKGLGVGNGTTKGDEEGEWTRIGQRGCTTIDYIIRNEEGRGKIQEIAVGNRIKSDHAPLELEVKWEEVRGTQEKRKEEKGSVIRWDTEGIEEYQRKLERSGEARNWKELKEKVADAILRIEVRGQREDCYEEKWWDEECHKRKIVLTKSLKEMRTREISEEECRKRRKEYRNFLEKKKREKRKEWLRELEKDKEMKMFWIAVSSCKKKGSQVDETITKDTWRDHFRGQYIIEEAAVGTPESNEREEEDAVSVEDITTEELRETIRKLKKKKAAGQDRITNETWIYRERDAHS